MRSTLLVTFLALQADALAVRRASIPAAPPPIKLGAFAAPSGVPPVEPMSPAILPAPVHEDLVQALVAPIPAKPAIHERAFQWYMGKLETKPLLTKSLSAAVVASLGNVLSQFLQAKVARHAFVLNPIKMRAFFLTGLAFVGPWFHVWYSALGRVANSMEVRYNSSKKKQTFAQIVLDQTFGVAFFFPVFFYIYEILESVVALRGTRLHFIISLSVSNPRSCYLQPRLWPLRIFSATSNLQLL